MTATKTRAGRIRGLLLVLVSLTVGVTVFWNDSRLVDSNPRSVTSRRHGDTVVHGVPSKARASPPATPETRAIASFVTPTLPPPQLRPLNFVHIPKTGGSAIETLATRAGLFWGKCLFVAQDVRKRRKNASHTKFVQCPPESLAPPVHFSIRGLEQRGAKPLWHTPPAYLPRLRARHDDDSNGNNNNNNDNSGSDERGPYTGFDLFAVLRNPYTRVLSVYYYQMKLLHGCRHFRWVNDPATLNAFVQENVVHTRSCVAAWNLTECMIRDQFIPQYMYVLDREEHDRKRGHGPSPQPPLRVVEHWLRFEHLDHDFDALMDRYDYANIVGSLSADAASPRTNQRDAQATLSPRDLNPTTVSLLQELYAIDFVLGAYSMDPMDA